VTANLPTNSPHVQPALRPKQERFAQRYAAHGNAARAYRETYGVSPDTRPGTINQRGYELAHSPAVAARVRELLAQAAEGTLICARARMVRLQAIAGADPSELVRVVAEPCKDCHATPAADADTTVPREDCATCRGGGVRRVVITPTDQLSPSARMLLKAVRQKDGDIEIRLHDQLAAIDLLNRMEGVYVDRSVTLNVHANVRSLRDMPPEQRRALLDGLGT
jgi:hypothetical protein